MKKIIALLLVLALSCGLLCGCGNGSQFTVMCNDGTVETMSRAELEDLRSNELAYQQKYDGAHVSGSGKIYAIEKQSWSSDGTIWTVNIQIDSFTTVLQNVPAAYAANYDVGDTIQVSGTLCSTMDGFARINADNFYN